MNGVILVNKQEGVTSRDVVNDISYIINSKKVGHTGTLDPLATGVLVVTIGKYTKLTDVLTSTFKEYIATFKLGILTDTLDITGNTLKTSEVSVTEDEIIKVVNSYQKQYEQTVPLYSAIKIKGKKLYEYAREGEDVTLPSRIVDIKEIEVLDIKDDLVTIKTLVSKGTYIRSLIRDIGASLGCGATMTSLIRTKQGKFSLEETNTVEEIRNNNYQLLTIEDVLDVEVIDVDTNLLFKVKNGVKLPNIYNKPFVLFKYKGEECCLYENKGDYYGMFLKLRD